MNSVPSDVTSVLFQDTMDPSRFVRIEKELDNTSVTAKVYFGSQKHMSYSGKVTLAKRLFHFDGTSRVGFNPVITQQAMAA